MYCSMAQLLRLVMWRRVLPDGMIISMRGLLSHLDCIREVINLYPKRGKAKHQPHPTVLTRMSRQRLVEFLQLESEKHHELGGHLAARHRLTSIRVRRSRFAK